MHKQKNIFIVYLFTRDLEYIFTIGATKCQFIGCWQYKLFAHMSKARTVHRTE